MSYKTNINNRSNKLITPTQISIFISIVIHVLLLRYGFTQLAIERDNQINIKETVPTIELTPEEQSRLPNLTPELNIPELNKTPLDENIAPFALSPSIPQNPNLFPDLPSVPLPPPPNSLPVPNLPLQQIPLPPLQSLPAIEPPLPSLPPLPNTDIKLPPIGDTSSLPLPPPVPPAPVDSTEKPAPPPTEKPSTQPTQPTQPEAKKPEEKKPPTPPAEPKPKLSPAQIAAQRQQKLEQEMRERSRSLQKNTAETTNEEARKNYVAWLSVIKEVQPEELTFEGTYPRDACIRRLEGTSVYGALVDPQGKVTDLELIKGAKYPIFNEQASKNISERDLANDTENIKPYRITVNFKYNPEICPSLTLPSLRRDNKPETEKVPSTPPIPSQKVPEPKT